MPYLTDAVINWLAIIRDEQYKQNSGNLLALFYIICGLVIVYEMLKYVEEIDRSSKFETISTKCLPSFATTYSLLLRVDE
jgi:hypothetical protein